MTVEIFLSDFQTVVNGVLGIFSFQRLMPVFLWKCFSVARLSFCLHLHFVILLCVWDVMGMDCMRIGGNGNVNVYSWSSLILAADLQFPCIRRASEVVY